MKIRIIDKTYDEVMALVSNKPIKPKRPNRFFRTLMKLVSIPDLRKTHFKCERIGMEKLPKDQPALFLMNHSSFIDLEIVATLLYPRAYNIITTTDGFIGKNWLMRQIGCIPTKKFVQDPTLVKDMEYAIKELGDSLVLFPEAGYSFDGTATSLPESLGLCIKKLKIPVVMITTRGAYARDPLYNNLQVRKVDVSATMEYVLSPEDIAAMSTADINARVKQLFSFDAFRWQQDNKIKISEPYRADYLNRVLYKCPHCKTEGQMKGSGIWITCEKCGKKYSLDEYGYLLFKGKKTEFSHIPDWYNWQREEVRREIESGKYGIDVPVDIMMVIDTKHLYRVGEGRLVHNADGFYLEGCGGKLQYTQRPLASYTLNADFNWYEIGDIICIGNQSVLYYCIPKRGGDIVAKARLATEEIYKIVLSKKRCKI